jgi:hypothetical protein
MAEKVGKDSFRSRLKLRPGVCRQNELAGRGEETKEDLNVTADFSGKPLPVLGSSQPLGSAYPILHESSNMHRHLLYTVHPSLAQVVAETGEQKKTLSNRIPGISHFLQPVQVRMDLWCECFPTVPVDRPRVSQYIFEHLPSLLVGWNLILGDLEKRRSPPVWFRLSTSTTAHVYGIVGAERQIEERRKAIIMWR